MNTNVLLKKSDLKLRQVFSHGAEKFTNNPLHLKLRSDIPVEEKLEFIPRMLFFVMGFKDLMQIVRFKSPQNESEYSVNTHSDEDSYHWEWYLNDLNKINEHFRESSSLDTITEVWDDSTFAVRKNIYNLSRHILNTDNAIARMLMVEILEVTFDKFKEAIHPVLKEEGLYSELEYFGLKHQETEEHHTTGISDDEISDLIERLPEEIKPEMANVIEELFDSMYDMMGSWAEVKEKELQF